MNTATVAAVSRIHALTPAQVQSQLQAGEAMLIDVRDPVEHAGARIPGATLMPLAKFDPAMVKVDGASRAIFHCKAGMRSAKACQKMLEAGHAEAWQLGGGIDAWIQAGLPVERDARAGISIIRQVQMVAGSIVLIGSLLGGFVSPWFFIVSGFIGAGLLFAGITDTCGMAMMLSKMPWNRTTT